MLVQTFYGAPAHHVCRIGITLCVKHNSLYNLVKQSVSQSHTIAGSYIYAIRQYPQDRVTKIHWQTVPNILLDSDSIYPLRVAPCIHVFPFINLLDQVQNTALIMIFCPGSVCMDNDAKSLRDRFKIANLIMIIRLEKLCISVPVIVYNYDRNNKLYYWQTSSF